MKIVTFFLVIAFSIFSCNLKKKLNVSKSNQEITVNNTNTSPKIVGEWSISIIAFKGLEGACNVCPKVNFNSDSSGKITKSTVEEVFKWKVNNDTLTIFYDMNIQNKTFIDDQYVIDFGEKDNYIELKLINENKERYFILRRER